MEKFDEFELDLEALGLLPDEPAEDKISESMPQLIPQETAPEKEPEDVPQAKAADKIAKQTADSWQKQILMYMHDLVYLLGVLLVVSLLLVRIVVVSGSSMNRTLLDGDYLFVLSNTLYRNPQQGDIVVVSKQSFDDGEPIVKRVIATEGQWVNIDKGIVYVGDSLQTMEPLSEEYTTSATIGGKGLAFPLQVDEGCVFCLGDNRIVSHDSRYPDIGMIDENEIMGKVVFLFVPGCDKDALGRPVESRDFSRIGVVD